MNFFVPPASHPRTIIKAFGMSFIPILQLRDSVRPLLGIYILKIRIDRSTLSLDSEALEGRLSTGRIPYNYNRLHPF